MSDETTRSFASMIDAHAAASSERALSATPRLAQDEQTVSRMEARATAALEVGANVGPDLARKWITLDLADLRTIREPLQKLDALDAINRSAESSTAYRQTLDRDHPVASKDVSAYAAQMAENARAKDARKQRDAEEMGLLRPRADAGPVIRPADNLARSIEASVAEEDRARREHSDLERHINSARAAERDPFDDPSYREQISAQSAAELRFARAERQAELEGDASIAHADHRAELDRVSIHSARRAAELLGDAEQARRQARLEAYQTMQRSEALQRYPELRQAYELRDASDRFRRDNLKDPDDSRRFAKLTDDYIRKSITQGAKLPEVKKIQQEQERERAKERERERTLESQRHPEAHLDR